MCHEDVDDNDMDDDDDDMDDDDDDMDDDWPYKIISKDILQRLALIS